MLSVWISSIYLKKHGRDKRKTQNRNMQMRSKCDFCKKWQNMFFLFIEAKHNKILRTYLSKAIFCKNRTLTSFAYCGFAFFAYHGYVFLSKWMKFILTAYFTLRNCSKTSVFRIFWFWVIFFIFEDSNAIFKPRRPIQNFSRFTQVSIAIVTLSFC